MASLRDPGQIDIALICIKQEEFEALLEAFPDEVGVYVSPSKRHYNIRKADAGGGHQYRLLIACQTRQGNQEAQSLSRDILGEAQPRLLLMAGIAGGVPSGDVSLGDVVVATRINDYTVHASGPSGTEYAIAGGDVADEIIRGIVNLPARKKDLGDWWTEIGERPMLDLDALLYGTQDAVWNSRIERGLRARFAGAGIGDALRARAGVIGSSDALIKDPVVLRQWIETARNLLAVEMESAGAYEAARGRCPMVAIRSISDIVGLVRDEGWVRYASRAAAAFTRAYLRTTPIAVLAERTGMLRSVSNPSEARSRYLPVCAPSLKLAKLPVGTQPLIYHFSATPPNKYDIPLSDLQAASEESMVAYRVPGQYGRVFRRPTVAVRDQEPEVLEDCIRWRIAIPTGAASRSDGEQLVAYADGRLVFQRESFEDLDITFVAFSELIVDTTALLLFATRMLGRTLKGGWFDVEVALLLPSAANRVVARFEDDGPRVAYSNFSAETSKREVVSRARMSAASAATPQSIAQEARTHVNRIANTFKVPYVPGPASMMKVEESAMDALIAQMS